MTTQLRRARTGDLRALSELHRAAGLGEWAEGAIERVLRLEARQLNVLVGATGLVGFIDASLIPPEAEIVAVAVHPNSRRRGHGRRLLDSVLRPTEGPRVQRAFLELRVSNLAARALYEGLGFTVAGRRSGYYPLASGGREDALLMDWCGGNGEAD